MTKIDTITLLKYQEGSLDDSTRKEVDKYLSQNPSALEEILDLDRISIEMDKGLPLPLPGTASVIVDIIQGMITDYQCNGLHATLIPVVETRGDARPHKHEVDKKKLKVDLPHMEGYIDILAVRGNAYWVAVHSPELSGHVLKMKRKGDDYPLYTKKATSPSLTIKGLGAGEYEILLLNECIDIIIKEKN